MTDAVRKYAQEKIMNKDYNCAKEYTLSMFSGKHKIVILYHLIHDGELRFNGIQKLLDNPSHKVLSSQLTELIEDGLVSKREEIKNNRRATFYCITETGSSLTQIIDLMFNWGVKRLEELKLQDNFRLKE